VAKKINSYPSHIEDLKLVKPHYIEFPSFQKDITNVKKFDELPVELKNYLLYISKELKSEIAFVSVGPDRKQTIICNEIWEKRR
jgi:adenylosuccinate synthase